jgi:hypothetical protein
LARFGNLSLKRSSIGTAYLNTLFIFFPSLDQNVSSAVSRLVTVAPYRCHGGAGHIRSSALQPASFGQIVP